MRNNLIIASISQEQLLNIRINKDKGILLLGNKRHSDNISFYTVKDRRIFDSDFVQLIFYYILEYEIKLAFFTI